MTLAHRPVPRRKPSQSLTPAAQASATAASAPSIDALTARIATLLGRWLDLYEGVLAKAESNRDAMIEAAAPKLPDTASLRELTSALTACMRLAALAPPPTTEGTDDAAARRDLEAVERALSDADS